MIFTDLNSQNFPLFAIKNYENPQAVTRADFDKDLQHFKYIKRLLKRYKDSFNIMDEVSAEKTISMWIHENGLDTLTETDGSLDDTFYKIKK